MQKFLLLSMADKSASFKEAATKISAGIAPSIVEKDFWVCWVLQQIFSHEQLAKYITFKGGTSLSKAYQLIERFSEDIDLTISKDAPYIAEGQNPMETGISGKERERRIKALKENAKRFVAEFALPTLQKIFEEKLSANDWELVLDPEDRDQQTILFFYPKLMNYGGGYGAGGYGVGAYNEGQIGYIKPVVKLEFGARGEIEPSENKPITPYLAEVLPQLFEAPHIQVHVLTAERTFWEKVTILHALHHGSKMRERMSRHYYDTYVLAQKGIAKAALQDAALLEKVVRNKIFMFGDSKASYETAVIGTLRLIPNNDMKAELKRDYIAMNDMFIGDVPSFETIMEVLSALEEHINQTV